MALEGKAQVLARCALFEDFTPTGLAIFAGIVGERPVPAGAPLFVEGMASDALYVVESGELRVEMRDAQGGQTELGRIGPNETLGQMALLQPGGVRLVTAIAAEPTVVLELRARDFTRLQAEKPQACVKLMRAIAQQLGRALGDSRDAIARAAQSSGPRG